MSHSQQRPEFPELAIPQSDQSQRRSPLRVIEPYVEFAADIEADIAKIEVGSEDRARTTSVKKSRERGASFGGSSNSKAKTPQVRSNTAGSTTQMNGLGSQPPRMRNKGPESGRSVRSPRAVKTAPESSRQRDPNQNHSPNKSIQSSTHFSEDDSSDAIVRESLLSLKRSNYKPPQEGPPAAIYENLVVPKSSFAKAVDSIAAMKLHDYALKRKERMKNRFKLWDEIKGTTREMEISSAEVAFMEFQEIIAAWKIKYYVTKSRDNEKLKGSEVEKKALIRQCKNLKKKNGQLQASIDSHLALNLAEEAQKLMMEKSTLEDELQSSRDTCTGLLEEIEQHKRSYSELDEALADQKSLAAEAAAASERKLEDSHTETSLVKEDLEVSRRTAQEYLRNVMQLEISLQERIDEITGLREGDLQESKQKSIRLEALEADLQRQQAIGRGDAEQIQALEQSVEGLQNDIATVQRNLKDAQAASDNMNSKNKMLNTQVEEQQFKINSLEKLVTEVTYQKEQLAKQLAEKGVVAGNYLVETVQLKEIIAAKENDLEEHKYALSQMEEYTKYAQDVNEIANAERETALMAGEDLLVQLQHGKDSLNQNEGYCRMLESQLVNARRKEHYSKQKGQSGVDKTLLMKEPMENISGGDTNIFNDKIDFNTEEADFSHPLEGKLVSLLSVLEEKLGILNEPLSGNDREGGMEKGSRRKSIQKISKDEDNSETNKKEMKDEKDEDKMSTDVKSDGKETEATSEKVMESDDKKDDGTPDEKEPPADEEVDWEEVCVVLEEQLANEKSKLEGLKQRLSEARESIQKKQKEKERVKVDIKKWQKNEQKRTGKFPTVKGNSVDSRNLFTKSDEIENEMQQHLVEAQTIATTALNCKMECDRIQDELYEADAEAYEVRLAAQQKLISEQEKLAADIKEVEREVAPKKMQRNENRATISMLNQDHFTSFPKRDDNDLAVLREEDEEEDDSSGGNRLKENSVDMRSVGKDNINGPEQMSMSMIGSLDSSEIAKLDSDYKFQLNKDKLDAQSCEELFRLIHTKLNYYRALLVDLEEEKNVSRRHIEKWTLFFLRDQGRVPGLSDSKYGANNLIFHNFNAVEGDIYNHHQAIQAVFSDFDSKRDGILNLNDQNLTEQLMQVEEHFNDPLFSLPENEEYEDSFKLHFESVESALLNGLVDDDTINEKDYLPNNTLVFDEIEDAGKLEILESLSADIKSFQDDVAELHISLQDSRENAERLHDSLKYHKNKIRQWHDRFEKKFDRQPTEEDKEKEASHLYQKAHEVHLELEAEMEKMRVFALIATAKNTEADRLKVLKRKFARHAPADYLPSEDSSVASSYIHQGPTLNQMQNASVDLRDHSKNTFESKVPSIRSDAGESEYRDIRESIEAEVVKMNEELDMLKNFVRSADTDIDNFRSQKAKLKSDAKKWEQSYQQQHGRKPTVDERKVQAEGLYESYAHLQEGLSQVLESRERAIKMITKIQQNCDRKRKKLAQVIEKQEMKYPKQ